MFQTNVAHNDQSNGVVLHPGSHGSMKMTKMFTLTSGLYLFSHENCDHIHFDVATYLIDHGIGFTCTPNCLCIQEYFGESKQMRGKDNFH